MDFTLPATGTYYVRVSSFAAPAGDPEYDPTNPKSPLNPGNLDSILNPLNPNFSQAELDAFLAAKDGTATGQYDLFIYRYAAADPTALNVNNVLTARGANTTLSGSTGTDTLIGPAGTAYNDTNNGAATTVSLTASTASPSVDLLLPLQDSVSLSGPTGSSPWDVTISYGDRTATTTATLTAGSVIPMSHQYAATGNYNATVTVKTGEGTFGTTVPVSVGLLQAPAETITAPAAGTQFARNTPITFAGTLQNPYVGVNYLASWTFTNVANPALVSTTSQTLSATATTSSLSFSTPYSFTTAATYSIQLTIEDLANSLSATVGTISGNAATFSVLQTLGTTTTATAPTATYNGQPYNLATASVIGADNASVTTPAVTFTYYKSSDTQLANPLSGCAKDAGSYLVVASFSGNPQYATSQSLPVSFSIGQAIPTITATAATITYNALAYSSATASATGFAGASLTATLAYYNASDTHLTSALSAAPTDAGNYLAVASYAGSTDYAATTLSAIAFSINRATPTVTATALGSVYNALTYNSVSATVGGIGITIPAPRLATMMARATRSPGRRPTRASTRWRPISRATPTTPRPPAPPSRSRSPRPPPRSRSLRRMPLIPPRLTPSLRQP